MASAAGLETQANRRIRRGFQVPHHGGGRRHGAHDFFNGLVGWARSARLDEPGDPFRLATVTSTTLLEGLKDPANGAVWEQWVDRYRPLVVRTARRIGVPAAEAEDVAQNALLAFALAYREGRYERSRGRLRAMRIFHARRRRSSSGNQMASVSCTAMARFGSGRRLLAFAIAAALSSLNGCSGGSISRGMARFFAR